MLVVKLGGELALPERRDELGPILRSIRAVVAQGRRVVVVHGGGPQTSRLMRSLGLEPTMVAGQRVTDEAALQCLTMAVAGEVSTRLVAAMVAEGIPAVGTTGISVACIRCVKRPPVMVATAGGAEVDYGLVGDVRRVDRALLDLLHRGAMVPILACIGTDGEGHALNVNGDTVAAEVAKALQADALVLVTSTPGVLRDLSDPRTRIPRMSVDEIPAAIAGGVIAGGMIAKMEEASRAVRGGVGRVLVLGGLGDGDLEAALDGTGRVGTAVEP